MKYKFKTKPYDTSVRSIKEVLGINEEYAYFMEMGTGKSKVLIDNIAILYDKGGINAAIIIAPKGFIETGLVKKYPYICQNMLKHR